MTSPKHSDKPTPSEAGQATAFEMRLERLESTLAHINNRIGKIEVHMAVMNTDSEWLKKAFWLLAGIGLPALLGIAIKVFTE